MNDKNEEYAETELKHIQLELKNNRTQHLRHFVDQYYCYKNGFVNSNGRAHWEAIVWNDRVSVAARKLTDRKAVVKEHIVPLKVITNYLEELALSGIPTLDRIKKVLHTYTIFGTITKEEDARLNKAGLRFKMPDSFYDKNHEWHGDVLARYRTVGIVME